MSKEKSHQIFVRGFGNRTNEQDLKSMFKKYGKIRDVNMKGTYAFVVMKIQLKIKKNINIFVF